MHVALSQSVTVLLQKQGDEQVSSRSEAAFPVAGVTVNLCVSFPELTEVILAHFHASCPVLVPFYATDKGLSDVERYRYVVMFYMTLSLAPADFDEHDSPE